MNKRRRQLRTRSRLGSFEEFILRAWVIRRAGWRARIALVLVTGGVAVVTNSWIGAVISTLWTLWFGGPIAFPEVSPWFGLPLIILGVGFAVWTAKHEQGLTVRWLGPDRSVLLDQLVRESVARCTGRLTASMASQDRVSELVANLDELPNLAESAAIPGAGRVAILTGPLGAGKSLAAERLFQGAIHQAGDPEAPVPVFLNARHVNADLRSHVAKTASLLGETTAVGAAVVVDQLDDLPLSDAQQLYEEAIALSQSWPNTGGTTRSAIGTVVVTRQRCNSADQGNDIA